MEIRDLGYEHTPDGDEWWIEPRREVAQMRHVNKVIIVGKVGADADERTNASGERSAVFSVQTTRQTPDGQRSDWHRVTASGLVLTACNDFIRKGSTVYITGRLQYGSYDRGDGLTIPTADIIADEVLVIKAGR